jgi:hypothetical protein
MECYHCKIRPATDFYTIYFGDHGGSHCDACASVKMACSGCNIDTALPDLFKCDCNKCGHRVCEKCSIRCESCADIFAWTCSSFRLNCFICNNELTRDEKESDRHDMDNWCCPQKRFCEACIDDPNDPNQVLCDDCAQYANIWCQRGQTNAILTNYDLPDLPGFLLMKACFATIRTYANYSKYRPGRSGYKRARDEFITLAT